MNTSCAPAIRAASDLRAATPADLSWLTQSVHDLARVYFPTLTIDRLSIREQVRVHLSSAQHCALVVDSSFLLAQTGPIPFAERNQSVVQVLHAGYPNHGARLLRAWRRWMDARPGIKLGLWVPLFSCGPRRRALFHHLGFQPMGDAYQYVKGASHGPV